MAVRMIGECELGIVILEASTNQISLIHVTGDDLLCDFKKILISVKPLEVLVDVNNITKPAIKLLAN